MKQWIGILALALLLTGCAPEEPVPTTTTPPPESTGATAPDPGSAWTLELDREYLALAPMGEDLVLFGDGNISLYRDGALTAVTAPVPLPETGATQVTEEHIFYYDATANALVTLDRELKEISREALTETVTGNPYVAPDGSEVFYCVPSGIRVWDPETGISRSLKLQEGDWTGITGSLFDGKYLICQLRQSDGSCRTLLISTENGSTFYEGREIATLTGSGSFYCCVTEEEWIFGELEQQPQNLLVEGAIPLPQLKMALTAGMTETGLEVKLYDLTTGRHAYLDCFPEASALTSPVLWQGKLVFLSENRLCFWDYQRSGENYPVGDESVYTANRYTAEDPDLEGLAALRDRAEALGQQYGIDILLWTDVTGVQPEGYRFTVEHRTRIIGEGLDRLEAALARFPEGFFKTAASWTGDGNIHIVLVRGMETPTDECGSQYLLGWDAYIPLSLGEALEQRFYHGLGHVVDTHVLSHSDGFYEWNTVNPSGFRYDNNYASWQGRESKYLEGSTRYFANSLSMTFPVEDRATLLEYAMMADNAGVFESQHMQTKLKRLRTGLREAFDLEGTSYPWEQYLK